MKNILDGLRRHPSVCDWEPRAWAEIKQDHPHEHLSPFASLNFTHVHACAYTYVVAMTSKFSRSAMTSPLSFRLAYPCAYSMSAQRWHKGTSISACAKRTCDLLSYLVLFQGSLPREMAPSPSQLYQPKTQEPLL